jgi:hypothetical protein
VLVRGFSDGRVQCTNGAEDARVSGHKFTNWWLIPGCSPYAPEVQCTSGVEDDGVKVSCGLYDYRLHAMVHFQRKKCAKS